MANAHHSRPGMVNAGFNPAVAGNNDRRFLRCQIRRLR
jgi:hypothetical protein